MSETAKLMKVLCLKHCMCAIGVPQVIAIVSRADGSRAASIGTDGCLRLWDTATGSCLSNKVREPAAQGTLQYQGLTYSPAGTSLTLLRAGALFVGRQWLWAVAPHGSAGHTLQDSGPADVIACDSRAKSAHKGGLHHETRNASRVHCQAASSDETVTGCTDGVCLAMTAR